jgi:hypothetical protein
LGHGISWCYDRVVDDDEVPRRAGAPYTLDYQRPDPAKPRGFGRLTVCFAAGVLAVLLVKVRQELSGNTFEGPDAADAWSCRRFTSGRRCSFSPARAGCGAPR